LLSVPPEQLAEVVALAAHHAVPVGRLGTTGGDALEIVGRFGIPLEELRAAHTAPLPALFG
jgi:phosphoribosylformylglycinamidine synthase